MHCASFNCKGLDVYQAETFWINDGCRKAFKQVLLRTKGDLASTAIHSYPFSVIFCHHRRLTRLVLMR
jgi:hypothetical protein